MKAWRMFFLFFFLPVLAHAQQQEAYAPFAVVELFTSEGCSSCPPADALLSKLVVAAREKNLKLYPLSFHIDYWNSRGWRDPFSKKEFTRRQYDYAQILGTDSVYTPQIVINGKDSLNGADSQRVSRMVNRALQRKAAVSIQMQIKHITFKDVRVAYAVDGPWQGHVLSAALVQKGLIVDVATGENAGRKLKHDHVVRDFKEIVLDDAKGEVVLKLPSRNRLEDCSIIVFVQDADTKEISGAGQINLLSVL